MLRQLRSDRYVGRRSGPLDLVLRIAVLVGLLGGPVYWFAGTTEPQVAIEVTGVGDRSPEAAPADRDDFSAELRRGEYTPVELTIRDWNPGGGAEIPLATKLLHRSDTLVLGLTVGLAAALLLRVLRDIRTGRPFERRNDRRLAWTAVVVVAGGMAAEVLRFASAASALGVAYPGGPPSLTGSLSFAPLLVGLFLLVLAEAFRQGGRLREDVEGLV